MSDKIKYDVAVWALKDLTHSLTNRDNFTDEELIQKLTNAMHKDKDAEGGLDFNWWNKFAVSHAVLSEESFLTLCKQEHLLD